ncbi:uncharacterized protein LOC132601629 [Lycium barbarum]|uniref:uncharacterized protein LOC132601629 n=1 Tax=Lycium barbarum TaxID=112863 RepID=UPI00293E7049|nr:uncharacterized protein LOC132601629 [Lycium barbarum]
MPFEVREAKATEFENLRQNDMTVQDYYLKFVSLYRHAPHVVSDMRAMVRRFVLKLKLRFHRDANTAAQNDRMTISKILAFVQANETRLKEEEALQKQKDREFNKRAKSAGNFSQRGCQGGENRSQSQASMTDRGFQHPTCNTYGKKHSGVCHSGMDDYFGCGQPGHFLRDCPSVKQNIRGNSNIAQSTNSAAPRNCQAQQGGGAAKFRNTGSGQYRLYAMSGR